MKVWRAIWPAVGLMLIVTLAAALCLLASSTLQFKAASALITMVAVVGLYMFFGVSGVPSFGHVSFMGIGAYATALVSTEPGLKKLIVPNLAGWLAHAHVTPAVGVLVGGVAASLFAAIVGYPLMKLHGLIAGIASLALLVIVNVGISQWDGLTGGLLSFYGIPVRVTLTWALVAALLAIGAAYAYQSSRFGKRLRATQQDIYAARAVGIDVTAERFIAFVLSAFVVGASGGLIAEQLGTITPRQFYFDITFLIVAMLIVGGLKSLSGAVVGALTISLTTELLRQIEATSPRLGGLSYIVIALFMLAVLILRPKGLCGGRELSWPPWARLRNGHGRLRGSSVEAPETVNQQADAE